MVESPAQTVATSPLLETKLYTPRWRTGLVPRPRLVERLDQGTESKLTLVSAPAGFGNALASGAKDIAFHRPADAHGPGGRDWLEPKSCPFSMSRTDGC